MSTALEDANKEVETILAAAVAENGKGVLQSGLDRIVTVTSQDI